MKKKIVQITGITDLYRFITEASKVCGDVLVTKGKFCIDGKSLMGLMSIDISTGAIIEYPFDAEDFDLFLMEFETKNKIEG